MPVMNLADRFARYCATVGPAHVLVVRREDIRWLTGFTGSTAQLIVHRERGTGVLFVDGRYVHQAEVQLAQCDVPVDIVHVNSSSTLEDYVAHNVDQQCAVHPRDISAERMSQLQAVCSVVNEPDHLDQLRRVKDATEVSYMERAAAIADEALASVLADGLVGKTEKQVRLRLDYMMGMLGADDTAFSTIVATGPNGAAAHHEPTDTTIENGHGVVIDMGAQIEGYRSDMTRTVLVGHVSSEYREMFNLVMRAQHDAVQMVRAGVTGALIDEAARKVFRSNGVEHELTHGTGHGIGLYIHEMPIFSPRCEATLAAGEVVTVEPGLYRGGVGGVRIEDLVVVTDTGCRILTLSPKELSCPQSPQTI